MVSTASSRAFIGLIAAALLAGFAAPVHAKEFLKGERPQTRGYSQAVITEGGKIVWLAGQLAVAQAASGGRVEVGLGAGSPLARVDHVASASPSRRSTSAWTGSKRVAVSSPPSGVERR